MSPERIRAVKTLIAASVGVAAAFGVLTPDVLGPVERVSDAVLVIVSTFFAADKIEAK